MRSWLFPFAGVGALAASAFLLTACVGGAPAAAPTAAVDPAEFDVITAKAEVVPVREARPAFKTGGRIEKLFVQAGDQVQEGDPLAQLELADFDLQVRAAEDT